VDRALEAFGMTAGPFRWADAMGFAAVVALHNAVRRSAGESLPSPPLLDAMAAHPDHGAAAGHGFYRYSSAGKPPEPDHDTHALLGVKRRRMPPDTREVVDRCVLSMANAACRLLATANPPLPAADLDAALALAVGFAPWRGGLLSYVDSRGLPDTIAALTDLAGRCGYRFSPDPLLTQMAERGDIFFPDRPRTLPPDPGPPSVCVDYFANRRVTRYFLAALPILLAVAYELIMRILRLF
jgi:3-hydroxyacyl-CoA dehydrogenase